ncbi:MAG: hypothetical protein ACHREM_07610, partial [Polyangiales bacterium]
MKTSDTRLSTHHRRVPSLARWTMGAVTAGLAMCSFGVSERVAEAGTDVAPSLPNVLLLIDTSGSMEYMPTCYTASGGTTSCDNYPRLDDGVTRMTPGSVAGPATYNRWASAVQVIAGTFKHYSLLDESRASQNSSGGFSDYYNEFGLLGAGAALVPPYDADQTLDHFRVMSNNCALGPNLQVTGTNPLPKTWNWVKPPGIAPGTYYSLAAGFDDSAASVFGARHWNTSSGAFDAGSGGCSVAGILGDLDGTGIVDVYASEARFGLMTFDSQTDGHTGLESPPSPNNQEGVAGLWSYFPGWYGTAWPGGGGVSPTYGWPQGCDVTPVSAATHIFENGARNPSAPPWEGPLVPFSPDDSQPNLNVTGKAIKLAMLAARPFGGTPIAAMLTDAENYYWNDPNGLTGDPTKDCRGDFIILITDGTPNQDLRPFCETGPTPQTSAHYNTTTASCAPSTPPTSAGCCPYQRPQDVAYTLAHPSNPAINHPVQTFVIGFAVSDDTGQPLCGDVTMTLTDGTTHTYYVNGATPTVSPAPIDCRTVLATDPRSACCTLEQIAINGSTGTTPQVALFADNATGLRAAVSAAMSAAIHSTASSRTVPVYTQSTSSTDTSQNTQYQYTSNFIPNPVSGWQGVLNRERITCTTDMTVPYVPDLAGGDIFAHNLADPLQEAARKYITFRTGVTSGVYAYDDSVSIRPNIISGTLGFPDGVLANSGEATGQNVSTGIGVVNTSVPSTGTGIGLTDLGLSVTSNGCKGPSGAALSAGACAAMQVNYAMAQPQNDCTLSDRTGHSGCPLPNIEGSPLADIFHANPVSVSPPLPGLRDSTYTTWTQLPAIANRPPFLLVATNDGILHAFSTAYNGTYTSTHPFEFFSFIPPAVMPYLPTAYGGVHQLLLDASPVVKDVSFGGVGGTVPWGRSLTDAQSGIVNWRTVAVGGLTAGGGYYALDVTDPTSPQMLWQLTTAGTGSSPQYPIFAGTPAPPEIGTVTVMNGATPVETPVAFLPGGTGTGNSGNATSCNRWPGYTDITDSPGFFHPRSTIPCWVGPGLSFTVVRLYDGVILRSFRNDPAAPGGSTHPGEGNASATFVLANASNPVVTDFGTSAYAGIDSPISGTIAIYPNVTGSVTSRAYVGDQDGGLWKLDLTSTNPRLWTFNLFHDAYNGGAAGSTGVTVYNVPTNSVGGTPLPTAQPVNGAPVLSTDNFGNTVILYATGNQSTFVNYNVNHVYSLTDPTVLGSGATPSLNWHLIFTDGSTPTGPLTLFNGALYMSTFTPTSTGNNQTCLTGYALLWGLDYFASSGSYIPSPRLPATAGTFQNAPTGSVYASGIGTTALTCPDTTRGAPNPAYPIHPSGQPFLMCAEFRREELKKLPAKALTRIILPELTREYTLFEIAIITSAGPARALGLSRKGNLGVGADA